MYPNRYAANHFQKLCLTVFWILGIASASIPIQAQDSSGNPAAMPQARLEDESWRQRHEAMNSRAKQGKVDLVFIGDSITRGWEGPGKEIWSKYYEKRNALNLGIGGDQTQHVLWRLDNGNLDGISPKLAVIMIGTNNAGKMTPQQVADGIQAIVERIRTKLPQTKILLLAILPRGVDSNDPMRLFNDEVNTHIAAFDNGESVSFLDIGSRFLAPDGTCGPGIRDDRLHLTTTGYAIWAEAIEPTVMNAMHEDCM